MQWREGAARGRAAPDRRGASAPAARASRRQPHLVGRSEGGGERAQGAGRDRSTGAAGSAPRRPRALVAGSPPCSCRVACSGSRGGNPPPLPLLQKGCGVPPSPRVASTPTPCGTPGGRRGDAPPTLLLWGTPYPQAPPAASRAALWAVPPPVAPPINGDAAPRRRVYARGGCSPPSTRPLAPLSCFPSGHRPCPVHRATPPRTPPSTPVPSSRRRPPPLVSRRYTPVR